MCKLWPWPWRYDPQWRSWYDCVIYYQGPTWQCGVMALQGFGYVRTVTLTLKIWPSVKVMIDTPVGHGQQLCEILSRSDKWVRRYDPDTMWTDGQIERQTDRGISYIFKTFVCGEVVGKIVYHSCHPGPLVITDNSSYLTYRISLQNSANTYYYNFN